MIEAKRVAPVPPYVSACRRAEIKAWRQVFPYEHANFKSLDEIEREVATEFCERMEHDA